ncbi:substrate-binding domain-containing protein [Amycolatopsis sp. NPDC006125]|uniref:sugar ABC transporter substrate-binding protein n=1 Tax=Amycolatopsis sp. NPDC006125 TaxID=3156730 RepID=UPI0033ABAB99
MTRWYRAVLLAAVTATAFLLSGCGDAAVVPAKVTGTGTVEGRGATIVAFVVSTANSYISTEIKAMRAEAGRLGYRLDVIDNNFDQTQQNQQVRQFLASGKPAAAFVYWPANNDTGVNSARLLAARAPVIQLNGRVLPQAGPYITARPGQDNEAIGAEMGNMALQAVAEARSRGVTFHGPGGKPNLLEITYPTGYETGIVRHQAFFDRVGDTFNVLATENVKSPDAQGGFTATSQILSKYKAAGIDFVVAGSNNIGTGAVKALQQGGLRPGEDVTVVVGDFSGDQQPLKQGLIYSAVLQSPVIEGILAIQTAARYLATGRVVDGVDRLPASADQPPVTAAAPSRFTYMPNPAITPHNVNTLRVWGRTVQELQF